MSDKDKPNKKWTYLPTRIIGVLEPTDFLVYVSLCYYCNDIGVCWPKISTIAKKTNLSESTVKRSIKKFKDKRIMVVQKRGNRNYYFLKGMVREKEKDKFKKTT